MIVECIPFNFWTDTFKPHLGRRFAFISVAAQVAVTLLLAFAAYFGIKVAVRFAAGLELPRGEFLFGAVLILKVIHAYYQWPILRYLSQKTGTEPSVRAELFTNGICPEGRDFLNGAHPFFHWRDLHEIELTYAGLHHTVRFAFAGKQEPYVWTLYSEQIAELGAAVASAPEMQESILARALAEHRTKLASGQTEGSITIKAPQHAKPTLR